MGRTPTGGRADALAEKPTIVEMLRHTHWTSGRPLPKNVAPVMSPQLERDAYLLLVAGRDVLLGYRKAVPSRSSNDIRWAVRRREPAPIGDPIDSLQTFVVRLSEGLIELDDVNARWRYLVDNDVNARTRKQKHLEIWATKEDYLRDFALVCLSSVGAADSRSDLLEAGHDLSSTPPSAIVDDIVRRQGALGALDEWYAATTMVAGWASASPWVASQTAEIYRQVKMWEAIYERGLGIAGRTLRPGASIRSLAMAVTAVLDGMVLRWYFDPDTFRGSSHQERLDDYLEECVQGVLAVIVGFSTRDAAAPSLAAELDGTGI